jgi:hypothetical protein
MSMPRAVRASVNANTNENVEKTVFLRFLVSLLFN